MKNTELKELVNRETITVYDEYKCLTSARKVFELMHDIKDENKEFFVVFHLNSKLDVIAREIVHIGTLDMVHVHPRDIFRNAILLNAKSIIISHNHPSGNCEPSDEDNKFTEQLDNIGIMLGIPVTDSIIVGETTYYSYNEHNKIKGKEA